MTQSPSELRPRPNRSALPRWVYQETVRRIFDDDPDRHLRLVHRPIDPPAMFSPQMSADFVVRPSDLWVFANGENRLSQVECVREIPKTLVARMLLYRSVINRANPSAELDQYVIVVGNGRVRPAHEPSYTGTYFGLKVLYLEDVDPDWFAAGPGFAFLRGQPVPPQSSPAPQYPGILRAADLALGRFLITAQDDDQHEESVLYDGLGRAREGLPEQLLSLYFQGRFGAHPEVAPENRGQTWPTDVAVALAVHAITGFQQVTARL